MVNYIINLLGGRVEKGRPFIIFHAVVQELDALVKPEDPDTVVEGSETTIKKSTYVMEVTLHDEPVLEEIGHIYKIEKVYLAGMHTQLW